MSSLLDPASLVNPTDASNAKDFLEAAQALPLPYDSSEEYRRLLESVTSSKTKVVKATPSGKDMDQYQYLMSRERRVLDTVDRIVNDSLQKKEDASTILGLPLHVLAVRCAASMRALLDDLVACKTFDDVTKALIEPSRLPYIGLSLIVIGVVVGFLEIASL